MSKIDLQSAAPELAGIVTRARDAARLDDWKTVDELKAALVREQDKTEDYRRGELLEEALSQMDKLNVPADPTAGMDAGTVDALTTHEPPAKQRCRCNLYDEAPIHHEPAIEGYHAFTPAD